MRILHTSDWHLGRSFLGVGMLPHQQVFVTCTDYVQVAEAIRSMVIRGAPAIGVAAAYGVCLGLQTAVDLNDHDFDFRLDEVIRRLAESRPTAVNLFWALERMRTVARRPVSLAIWVAMWTSA